MPNSAPRFKGKNKKQIADEAFQKLGKNATIQQVDHYFQKYGITHCERSMYQVAKRKAEGKPTLPRQIYPRYKDNADMIGFIVRIKQLASDVGGYDKLEELIKVIK